MSVISEMPEIDSGLASPEIAPEDQILMENSIKLSEDEKSAKDEQSNEKTSNNEIKKETEVDNKVVNFKGSINKEENLDEDDFDETIGERLMGLTEMFPDSVRSVSSAATNSTISLIKGTYNLTRQVVWIGVTTSIILFAPVMFELERFNVEEMVKQDRNRLVLGPGTAMSGSQGGGIPSR